MSSMLYYKARELFLTRGLDWVTDPLKLQLIDAQQYTPSPSHIYLSEIPIGARIHDAVELTGRTALNGTADADDITIVGVPADISVGALIVYRDSGDDSTSHLVGYLNNGNGLPFISNGNDIILTWNNGFNRIFGI